MKYKVTGASRETGRDVTLTLDAASALDASEQAQDLGVLVRDVLNEPEQIKMPSGIAINLQHPSTTRAGAEPVDEPEQVIWTGHPSNWTNFGKYCWLSILAVIIVTLAIASGTGWAWILLMFPICIAAYATADTRRTNYTITSQRMRRENGFLLRQTEEMELYRVKDTKITQNLGEWMVGLKSIVIYASDRSTPMITIPAISQADDVREKLRRQVERIRRARGVRELDVD